MGKLSFILIILSFFIIQSSISYCEAKVRITKLHFFLHDRLSGTNQTEYTVAQSNITSTSPALFGLVNVLDSPFTIGPKPESKILGRAQGTVSAADSSGLGFHMSMVFLFTDGKYNGSTLTMIGRNFVSEKYRKMPIVGGTGAFELARGIATTSTYYIDNPPTNGIFKYKIDITTE